MSVELAVVSDSQTKQKDDNPYEEYMWMGEEEQEFEEDVLAQLEEEEFLESCLDDMLEEEALGLFSPPPGQAGSSSSSTTAAPSSMPLIENLNIGNSNGDDKSCHGNGDVILMPASDVAVDAGAGGDAQCARRWQGDDPDEKSENLSDSDSSEGCPQR